MYIYVLEDFKGKQYVGITTNLERRFKSHKRGHTVATSKMNLVTLEIRHYWNAPSYSYASRLERYLHSVKPHVVIDLILDCPLWGSVLKELAETKELLENEKLKDNLICQL